MDRPEPPGDDSLRAPPTAIHAEQNVLGALLLHNAALDRISDRLRADDFYAFEHRLLFSEISLLAGQSKPVDLVTVWESLRARNLDDKVGGLKYLNDLAQCVPSAANIEAYAAIVADRAMLRRTIAASNEIATEAFKAPAAGPVVERGIQAFTRISQGMEARRKPRQLREIAMVAVDAVEARSRGEQAAGWPLGLPEIDDALNGGLKPGFVYVLAARPSVGKSSLAQRCGLKLAAQALPTLFLSQEMPEAECALRALSHEGRVPYGRLQTGKLESEDWGRLADGLERAGALPYWVDDQAALRLADIRAKARAVPGLKVLVIDYVQLCASDESLSNRNLEVEAISRGLKVLAKELGLAVILLSQLNREVEKRSGQEPLLSDLRDSGAIEQDADVVWFLWPVGSSSTWSGPRTIGSKIAKNRQGRLTRGALSFDGSTQSWSESTLDVDEAMKAGAKHRASGI